MKSPLQIARDCLCSNADPELPFVYTSKSHVLELQFNVFNMTVTDDYRLLGFEGTWEFIRKPLCTRKQKLSGPSGEIPFMSPNRTPDEVSYTYCSLGDLANHYQ
jgi:hypothetical protein